MRNGDILIFNICDTRRTLLPHASPSVKNPNPGSTEKAIVTDQQLTRGLFNRLDGVIAYPEEITNVRPALRKELWAWRVWYQHTCRSYGQFGVGSTRSAPNRPRNLYSPVSRYLGREPRWRPSMRIYDIDGAAGRNFQLEPVGKVSADAIITCGVLSRWHRCGSPCNRNGHLFPWKCWQGMASWEPRANCPDRARPEPVAVAERGGSDPVQRQIRRLSCNQDGYRDRRTWSR